VIAINWPWKRYGVFSGSSSLADGLLALRRLVSRGLVDGPDVGRYEGEFARAAGTEHAVSFGAGRMALFALLEALGIGPGDEVIVPAFTCVVVPNAIIYRGAVPVYADIDPQTYNIDAADVERRITSRTRAVIAQHTFGLVCDIERLNAVCSSHSIAVIEDAAHALGASHRGRKVGSLSRAAYFSTDHTKVISTGTGGMATTDDAELAVRLRRIQARTAPPSPERVRASLLCAALEVVLMHPALYRVGSRVFWRFAPWRLAFYLDELETDRPNEYPVRLSNAQSALGRAQLRRLEVNLAWRRRLGMTYEAEMGALTGRLEPGAANHAFLRYSFNASDRRAVEDRLASTLDMGRWFTSVVHGRDDHFEKVCYAVGSCPNAEFAAEHCVNLPTHQRVDDATLLVRGIRGSGQVGTPVRQPS
jgi:dTDP-4-amino-4,6-dideoxygalactose transaminase